MQSRVLALDIGLKRTGLAVSDESRTVITPLPALQTDTEEFSGQLFRIIEEYQPGLILIGWPYTDPGFESAIHAKIETVKSEIETKWDKGTVKYWDEGFTSVEATSILSRNKRAGKSKKKQLQRKEHVNSVAASLILRSYLDHQS